MSAEEFKEYAAYNATFKTPTSLSPKKLAGLQLGNIGFRKETQRKNGRSACTELHLEDATRIVARQTLAAGATPACMAARLAAVRDSSPKPCSR